MDVIEEYSQPTIGDEVLAFTSHIDSLRQTLPMTMMLIQAYRSNVEKRLMDFEQARCSVAVAGDKREVQIPIEHYSRWKKLKHRRDQPALAGKLVPRSIFVSLVSQFDAFLGKLLRIVFISKPELLNASKREIEFSDLVGFASIGAAREFVIGKEIETILRMSRADQFGWMESRFSVPLTKTDAWPIFIELTQRRNLFVHSDGLISAQYLSECRKHGFPLDSNLKEGESAEISHRYFDDASACVFEIGVKLAQVLWRKLIPGQIENADGSLLELTYDLIVQKDLALAIPLLEFAVSLPRFADGCERLAFIVNLAQAYKWHGKTEECENILRKEDWSVVEERFKLAEATLREDWARAGEIMQRIGTTGVVSRIDYRDWPLFQQLRTKAEFLKAYGEVFGEPYQEIVASESEQAKGGDEDEAELNMDFENGASEEGVAGLGKSEAN